MVAQTLTDDPTDTIRTHSCPRGPDQASFGNTSSASTTKSLGFSTTFWRLTAVFVGMLLSLLMRIHMVWPTASIPFFGDIKPETYVMLVTMHGTIMVFFVLTTAPQGGFGNYFLPIQIGAPDMAFPVLNMLSFWTTFVSFMVMLAAFFVTGGAPLHGWTGYAPLSAVPSAGSR